MHTETMEKAFPKSDHISNNHFCFVPHGMVRELQDVIIENKWELREVISSSILKCALHTIS